MTLGILGILDLRNPTMTLSVFDHVRRRRTDREAWVVGRVVIDVVAHVARSLVGGRSAAVVVDVFIIENRTTRCSSGRDTRCVSTATDHIPSTDDPRHWHDEMGDIAEPQRAAAT